MNAITTSEGSHNVTIWLLLWNEALQCLTDLRWGVILVFILIFTDYHFGCSESKMRYKNAKEAGDNEKSEKYRFHLSRALRRSFNKFSDYLLMLLVGCIIGLAITEPLGICNHTIAAAMGLIVATTCEVSSIIGHLLVLKGIERPNVTWKGIGRFMMKFIASFVKTRNESVGEALDDAIDDTFDNK